MKRIVFVFLCTLCAFSGWAQGATVFLPANSVDGSYTDLSGRLQGPVAILKEPDWDLASQIMVYRDRRWVALKPADIEGYTFGNRRFVSARVEYDGVEQECFLEEIITAGDSLRVMFHFRRSPDRHVFYMTDGTGRITHAVPDNEPGPLWELVEAHGRGCDRSFGEFPRRATKSRLVRYRDAYRDCNPNLFPRPEFGVAASAGAYRPMHAKGLWTRRKGFAAAYTAGVWFKVPLDGHWSLRPEVNFFHVRYANGYTDILYNSLSENIAFEQNSVQVPIMVRYSFNGLRGRAIPYFELGATLEFPTSAAMGSVGAGMEWRNLVGRHSLYTGVRGDFMFYRSGIRGNHYLHNLQHGLARHSYVSLNVGVTIF